MKKFLTVMFTALFLCCFTTVSNACDIEGLYNNYQAVYIPSSNLWTTGSMSDDRIILTKKVSDGSGNYSEYYNLNGNKAIALDSNFEFIKNGKLIAVDNAGLKYYKVIYDGNNFKEIPLCEKELQSLFPKAEIIKISQFKDNKITVKKKFMAKKPVLLVNDTDKYFHKYTYKPASVQKTDIKGLILLSKYGNVKFSLYGDKKDMLTIKVR